MCAPLCTSAFDQCAAVLFPTNHSQLQHHVVELMGHLTVCDKWLFMGWSPSLGSWLACPSLGSCHYSTNALQGTQFVSSCSFSLFLVSSTQSVLRPKINDVIVSNRRLASDGITPEVYIFGKDFTPSEIWSIFSTRDALIFNRCWLCWECEMSVWLQHESLLLASFVTVRIIIK